MKIWTSTLAFVLATSCEHMTRMNINTAKQYRWHRAVDEVYDFMRTKNTRLCKLSGKSIGEVMPNFIVGLDKMCLMSDCHGNIRVFAAADKKKQEKLLKTAVAQSLPCAPEPSGITGPTIFLLKGTKHRNNFNDDYLLRYGMEWPKVQHF